MVERLPTPTGFKSLATLLAPADGQRAAAIVEPDGGWSIDRAALHGATYAVWGRLPAGHVTPPEALGHAFRREMALAALRLRPPAGLRVIRVARLPAAPHSGRLRNAVRSLLMSGAAVELASREWHGDRVLDRAMSAAQFDVAESRNMAVSRDGSIRWRLTRNGARVLLRVAATSSGKHPRRAAEALRALEAAGVVQVPRLLGEGSVAGDDGGDAAAEWSLESWEAGRIPGHISSGLWDEISAFAGRLRRVGRPGAIDRDLARIAESVPGSRAALAELGAGTADRLRSVPAVIQHGDLVRDNLLVLGGALAAVVDWDTWQADGTPGVDLLELFVSEQERGGADLTDLCLARVWSDAGFRSRTSGYWRTMKLNPDTELLDAVGVAWWASRVAMLLRRPERSMLLTDVGWLRRTIEEPVAALIPLIDPVPRGPMR